MSLTVYHRIICVLSVVVFVQPESADWAWLLGQKVFSLQLRILRCKNKWMSRLHWHKAKKGEAKTRGSSCLADPDGDISCSSSVQCTDFRCIRQEKSSRSSNFSIPSVEQVCPVVVTPWPVTLQKQLLRRKKHVNLESHLFRVCRIRCDKKTIGFLVVCMFLFFFYLLT